MAETGTSLRIAHFLPNLAIGGRERVANDLCRIGPSIGLTPILIGYEPLPATAAAFKPAARYFQLDRLTHGFQTDLRQLLHDQSIDVVHVHGHVPAHHFARAMTGWDHAPACLATMHVGLQGTWRWAWPIRRALRTMDALTAVSRDMASTYTRLAGRPVAVIANGMDRAPLDCLSPAPPAPGEPFRFAMLSRLDPVKRHVDAVHAADALIAGGLRVELHIAGEGECGRALQGMTVTRPWLHLAGPVNDTAAFLAGKHAFVMPSCAEGTPLALMEAMAAGLPSIVSQLPSLHDLAGDSARYVPARNPQALAKAMADLMCDSHEWAARSVVARNRARGFDLSTVAAQYADICRAIICSRA